MLLKLVAVKESMVAKEGKMKGFDVLVPDWTKSERRRISILGGWNSAGKDSACVEACCV